MKDFKKKVLMLGYLLKDRKNISKGSLYALVEDRYSIVEFQNCLNVLKRTGLLQEADHRLSWASEQKLLDE